MAVYGACGVATRKASQTRPMAVVANGWGPSDLRDPCDSCDSGDSCGPGSGSGLSGPCNVVPAAPVISSLIRRHHTSNVIDHCPLDHPPAVPSVPQTITPYTSTYIHPHTQTPTHPRQCSQAATIEPSLHTLDPSYSLPVLPRSG